MENRGEAGEARTTLGAAATDEETTEETREECLSLSIEDPSLSSLGAASDEETTEESRKECLSLSIEEMKPSPPSSLHVASTVALCMCTLTHSYLLISVFPYSGFMAIELLPSVNDENAGSYAGLIASSFMLGRAVSSYGWGKWADVYGRTTVLYISLGLSCVFTLLFGMSTTFASAIFFRCLLGLSNGIVGTAKCIVSELANGNDMLETKLMALVVGMWAWGFLFSPALSGALAEPVRQYPNAAWVQRFEGILSKYPFLLPNIVAAGFCVFSLIAVTLWVQETLPREKRRSPKYICRDCIGFCFRRQQDSNSYKALPTKNAHTSSAEASSTSSKEDEHQSSRDEIKRARLEHGESCLMLSTTKRPLSIEKDVQPEESSSSVVDATMTSLWARPDTRIHLIVYWVFSFVMRSVDESFPLFCISKEEGLGLSEAKIGRILSGSGVIFAVCQYFVYTFIVNRYGLYASIKIGSAICVPMILLIPASRLFNGGSKEGEMTWTTFLYLSVVMATLRMFGLVFFSSITVTTNRTVPASQRATMNGLSMLGGSATKGVGPAFAGYLVAFCFSGVFSPRLGAVVVFFVISLFACMVAIPSATILDKSYEPCPEKEQTDQVQ